MEPYIDHDAGDEQCWRGYRAAAIEKVRQRPIDINNVDYAVGVTEDGDVHVWGRKVDLERPVPPAKYDVLVEFDDPKG